MSSYPAISNRPCLSIFIFLEILFGAFSAKTVLTFETTGYTLSSEAIESCLMFTEVEVMCSLLHEVKRKNKASV